MANESYRCPLCPADAPEFELAGTKAESVYEWPPSLGRVRMVTAKLADGTTHEHSAAPPS